MIVSRRKPLNLIAHCSTTSLLSARVCSESRTRCPNRGVRAYHRGRVYARAVRPDHRHGDSFRGKSTPGKSSRPPNRYVGRLFGNCLRKFRPPRGRWPSFALHSRAHIPNVTRRPCTTVYFVFSVSYSRVQGPSIQPYRKTTSRFENTSIKQKTKRHCTIIIVFVRGFALVPL